jgi:phosphoserine phosphatase
LRLNYSFHLNAHFLVFEETMKKHRILFPTVLALLALAISAASAQAQDPLPSWNEGAPKKSILAFVDRVTNQGSPDFVPPAERIAVFDNDGTLWSEQPLYFQLLFALDRVQALAPQHPEWKDREPLASLLKGDVQGALAGGEKAIAEIVMSTHTGMTTEEFERIVRAWIATAKHPQTGRRYTEMVYQPMLELLGYLRVKGFKTFIVSGGGIEFMRPWAEKVYGIPPEQVIGSSIKTKFEVRDGKPVLIRLPELNFIDDKAGKPVGIQQHIGRQPIAAFGNSDGDLQMLQWTTAGAGLRFGLIVHHTDGEREWAYDRKSPIGRLDQALDEAGKRGWVVVDMKRDWKRIYPFVVSAPPQFTGGSSFHDRVSLGSHPLGFDVSTVFKIGIGSVAQ